MNSHDFRIMLSQSLKECVRVLSTFYHTFWIKLYFSGWFQALNKLPNENAIKLKLAKAGSKSQLFQDIFALHYSGYKYAGFFVEFGATNGLDLSNTLVLEKHFNWQGILAEPARVWQADLKRNRNCFIEESCVWVDSNSSLQFDEVSDPELSTISDFKMQGDWALDQRQNSIKYEVNTISLHDLLVKYNAPDFIDYLSIDTEGSEYEILSNFDFSKYKFRVITCEHNYTSDRKKIYDLLTKNGYTRVHSMISKWDDWYVYSR